MMIDPVGLSHPVERWRLRYWSIFTGQAVSLIGSALTQFVLLWWITSSAAGALPTMRCASRMSDGRSASNRRDKAVALFGIAKSHSPN